MWDSFSCIFFGRKCNRYSMVGRVARKFNIASVAKWFI